MRFIAGLVLCCAIISNLVSYGHMAEIEHRREILDHDGNFVLDWSIDYIQKRAEFIDVSS